MIYANKIKIIFSIIQDKIGTIGMRTLPPQKKHLCNKKVAKTFGETQQICYLCIGI